MANAYNKKMQMIPKVFLSHASEDKERFVLKFAERLREKGIDVWLDRWEMYPGDSLIYKIFEEGLKNAQAVIVVLSHNSINKPWVIEELDASMVKKITQGSKLIPVIIDNCDVPQCLQSTVWEKIKDINNYEKELDRIIMSIFGYTQKPILGSPPKYATNIVNALPDLNAIDSLILKIACEKAIKKSYFSMHFKEITDELNELQISKEDIFDSFEILGRRGYFKIQWSVTEVISYFSITTYGFDEYTKNYLTNYDTILKSVIFNILNKNIEDNRQLAERLHEKIIIINHFLNLLDSQGLIKILTNADRDYITIHHISPELKRAFR